MSESSVSSSSSFPIPYGTSTHEKGYGNYTGISVKGANIKTDATRCPEGWRWANSYEYYQRTDKICGKPKGHIEATASRPKVYKLWEKCGWWHYYRGGPLSPKNKKGPNKCAKGQTSEECYARDPKKEYTGERHYWMFKDSAQTYQMQHMGMVIGTRYGGTPSHKHISSIAGLICVKA
jgi:hypothetical protein